MSHDRTNPLVPVLSALLAGALALSLPACGSKEQKTEVAGGDTVHSSTETPPAGDTTAAGADMAGDTAAAPAPAGSLKPVKPATESEHIVVQHILIGFQGSIPGKKVTRTKDEAGALAKEVLERAWKGEDFNALVGQYTDDSPPGIYGMSNRGATPAAGEYPRDGMVPAFGNVGFAISVGNISMAEYDPRTSPYGWHVIKRLK